MCVVLEKIYVAMEIVFVGFTLLTEQSVLKSSPNEKNRCAHRARPVLSHIERLLPCMHSLVPRLRLSRQLAFVQRPSRAIGKVSIGSSEGSARRAFGGGERPVCHA
jgi:hypothetical protein